MKKIVPSIIGIILTILISTQVQAVSFSSNLNVDTEELKKGDEVILTLNLDEYKNVDRGINAYKATLEYDKSIFEEVVEANFKNLNDWEMIEYNKTTQEFVAIKKAGSQNSEAVVQIKLKVKSNAVVGKTNIKIKDMVTSEGKEDLLSGDLDKEINIIKIQDTAEDNKWDNSIEEAEKEPSKTEEIENQATGKIPKTGVNFLLSMIPFAIEVLIIWAIVVKLKEKKLDKKTFISIFAIVLSAQLVGNIYATVSKYLLKGELNDDTMVNYSDVKLLEQHLINKRILPDDKLENADINSDGKITITDLSLLVQKIEDNLEYSVEIDDNNLDSCYVGKNEEITLRFFAEITNDAKIRKAIINEKEYDVEEIRLGEYQVKIPSGNNAGIQSYNFSKVKLNTGKTINVYYTIKRDVLKNMPEVDWSSYTIKENIDNSTVNISFDVTDLDNSITSAGLELLNDENEVYQAEIKKGNNKFENISVENGKTYKVNIVLNYDLDSNQIDEDYAEDHEGQVIYNDKEFQFAINYNFQASNFNTYRYEAIESTFEKNEEIKVKFESSNATIHEPSTIKIDGKKYNVTKEGNLYVATIAGKTLTGKQNIVIEKITLSNGEEFEVENNIEVSIIKEKPSIENFVLEEDIEQDKLKLTFNLKDTENTIKIAKLVIEDEAGKEIATKEITGGAVEESFEIVEMTASYKVKIISTYNLAGEDIADSILYENIAQAKPKAKIKNVTSNYEYVEKNQEVKLTYEIATNQKSDISYILVNSTQCTPSKLDSEKYEVKYNVGSQSGINKIIATKIIFSDEIIVNVNSTIEVDVLKDKPSITEIKQEDDINNSQVTLNFEVVDRDSSFINGKAILTKVSDGAKQEKEIQVGDNSLTFDVIEKEIYSLEIKATYDRDTNTLNEVVTDDVIETMKMELLANYNLEVSNMETSLDGNKTKYFEKNTPILVSFKSSNESIYTPINAVVGGKLYKIIQNENGYQVKIDEFKTCGIKNISIDKIILNNEKELVVSENNQTNIEILKEKPTANEFTYLEKDDNKIEVSFKLNDNDNAVIDGKATIKDEYGKEVITQNLKENINTITFNRTSSESYNIEVVANYDLDTNSIESGVNEYKNQIILKEKFDVAERLIEMKDITNVTLYKQQGDKVNIIDKISTTDLENVDNYLVKVEMKNLPSFYSKIRKYNINGNSLSFELDYGQVVQYSNSEKHNWLEVEYGKLESNVATRTNLETLIEQIKNNPDGNYELNADIDATGINNQNAIFDVDFTGTLNGNGHKIKNLSIPLFASLNKAKIENFVVENANMRKNGVLTGIATSTTVNNVHIINSSISAVNQNGTGIMFGIAQNQSLIEKCSASNVNIAGSKRSGGLVGRLIKSTIKNTYITGNMSSTNDGSGAFVGQAENGSVIENCYANVVTKFGVNYNVGGFLGYSTNPHVVLKNNLSLCTAVNNNYGYRVYATSINGASTNNYELETSNLVSNSSHNAINTVSEATIKSNNFYKDNLGWGSDIWDYSQVQNGKYPTLKNSDPNYYENIDEKPSNSELYIPNYSRIKKLSNYNANKEIAYHNLNKFMPFYDSKYIVIDGEKIKEDDLLNTKIIKAILPLDSNNKQVVNVTEANYKNIAKINVLFTDNTTKEYTLEFAEYKGNIVSYKIKELGIIYNYNNFVLKQDATIIDKLVKYVDSLDYTEDLDVLTSESDSRLYKDFYNQSVKTESLNIVLELLQHTDGNIITMENNILNKKLEQDLINDGKLKNMLYAYNYYKRWYSINIENINALDLLLFNGDIFSDNMTTTNMLNEVMVSSYRATSATNSFYGNNIAKYTGINNIGGFLDYIITTFGKYEDVNDWFTNNYQGIVYEVPAEGYSEIEYRAWRNLKIRTNCVLPVLTLPENSAYVISSPTQILFGSQRIYIKDPSNKAQRDNLKELVKSYGTLIKNFYTTSAGFIEPSRFNNYVDAQYDRRTTTDGIWNSPGTTEDPFHKNFSEALGKWAAANGSAAYANGGEVYWNAYQALRSFSTWSHESGHNQDSKIFLKGAGRRGGAEDYADGNISQGGGDGAENFNLSYECNMDSLSTTNLLPSRINTTEKINSYYKEMYEAIYLLDYLEAKAFLQLTPEEQAKVSTQVFYPNESNHSTTGYRLLTADQIKTMNLKTIEDIYDNHIILKVGVTGTTSVAGTGGLYGYEGMYTRRWYQPHNDNGRPDSYSFKHLAWEMLGVGGYDNGYINYYSKRSNNDLDGLQKATGDSGMTWRKYKVGRYNEVEAKLNKMNYLDVDYLVEQYKEALKTDAQNSDRNIKASTNVRRTNYHYLKRVTNDFTDKVYSDKSVITHIKTANEFQKLITQKPYGYYILDNDINVSGLTGTNAIIDVTFYGRLDGNGHSISGNTLPIFSKLNFSYINNLTIKDYERDLATSDLGILTKANSYTTIKDVTYSERKTNIESVEDFLKIQENLGKSYFITKDIDFSGYEPTSKCLITGIFTGKIIGNGHTISNLNNATLFEYFRGEVTNLNINNFTNVGKDFVTAFANESYRATFKDMKFTNITLSGGNNVAVVVGMDGRSGANSTFERISVENANVTGTGVYVSAFVGRKFGGKITDCYVQGEVNCNSTECAGALGASQEGAVISNVIANVNINRPKNTDSKGRNNTGGLLGNVYNSPVIKNCISIGNMTGYNDSDNNEINVPKFVGCTSENIEAYFTNNYEYQNATGASSITESTAGHLDIATEEDIHNMDFYKNKLFFDDTIWNLETVSELGYPKLK